MQTSSLMISPSVSSPPVRFAFMAMLIVGLTAGGCSSTPRSDAPDASAAATIVTPTAVATQETRTAPLESPRPEAVNPWEDPANPLFRRTLYFDYDSVEIKPEYLPLLNAHADYLGSRASRRVTLEGHTDERGTREYNLSLGDQRAETVRRFMLAEGVSAEQMATLSYGEERPADLGHSDPSWRANRRVVIQY